MDSAKLAEAFETLKSLVSGHRSGAQWSSGGKPKPRPPVPAQIQGWDTNITEAEIVDAAEEGRIAALGLGNHKRFSKRDSFVCSCNQIREGEPHRLGASMVLDGRQLYLNQTLAAAQSWLIGGRTLLSAGDHVGRRIKLAYKREDGLRYFVCHQIRGPYVIVRHGLGWLELDRPVEHNPTGYLIAQF